MALLHPMAQKGVEKGESIKEERCKRKQRSSLVYEFPSTSPVSSYVLPISKLTFRSEIQMEEMEKHEISAISNLSLDPKGSQLEEQVALRAFNDPQEVKDSNILNSGEKNELEGVRYKSAKKFCFCCRKRPQRRDPHVLISPKNVARWKGVFRKLIIVNTFLKILKGDESKRADRIYIYIYIYIYS